MLQIDLRSAVEGPVAVALSVPADDPLVAQFGADLRAAVRLSGRLMETGPAQYFWQGQIHTVIRAECRRCLAETDLAIDAPVSVLFTEEANPEDPAAYGIPPRSTHLDLSEAVREELTLAVPEYVLCREDCRGLCPQCGTDLNTGTCRCSPEPDARWAALQAIDTPKPDHARE